MQLLKPDAYITILSMVTTVSNGGVIRVNNVMNNH
ncbi:MAG: hypothetical protein A07HR60_02096 [uncultured archaeon A07HR60]|nr:MAG: hypothetical protein A07HR60_02096 [uncultured archaeon A07HR60]